MNSGAKKLVDKATDKLFDKWWFWLGATALAGGAGYILYKKASGIVQSVKDKVNDSNIDSNNISKQYAVKLAVICEAAFVYSGNNWMREFDGTNEQALYEVAKFVGKGHVKWSDLADAYKRLTGRNLIQELQSELEPEELMTFWNHAGRTYNGVSGLGVMHVSDISAYQVAGVLALASTPSLINKPQFSVI